LASATDRFGGHLGAVAVVTRPSGDTAANSTSAPPSSTIAAKLNNSGRAHILGLQERQRRDRHRLRIRQPTAGYDDN